jgi:N-acetylneuraminic acid mutarotase
MYDALTNKWATASLSDRPGEGNCCQGGVGGITATVIGSTIYFAGGEGWDVHKAVDIYNTATNQWSTSSLHEYKGFAAGIAIGNTNYWAGGATYSPDDYSYSSQVEIRDIASGSSTFGSLFQGNAKFSAVQKNNTIVFFTGLGAEKNKFDIYDINTKTWSIGVLPENVEGAAIISVNNTIYVAGGRVNGILSNQLRQLEF